MVEQDEYERVKRENDFLRALVGNSDKACVYCGLGADEQAKCVMGFPGCARGDDQMLCRNFGDAAALHDMQKEADLARMELQLTANAYNASLELQNTLIDRCERLQKLVDAQSREIELHQSHASTVPKV
jgi:hypothetical protein